MLFLLVTWPVKGAELQATKSLNLLHNIASLQVLVDVLRFSPSDQLVVQQKHLLWVQQSCCEK